MVTSIFGSGSTPPPPTPGGPGRLDGIRDAISSARTAVADRWKAFRTPGAAPAASTGLSGVDAIRDGVTGNARNFRDTITGIKEIFTGGEGVAANVLKGFAAVGVFLGNLGARIAAIPLKGGAMVGRNPLVLGIGSLVAAAGLTFGVYKVSKTMREQGNAEAALNEQRAGSVMLDKKLEGMALDAELNRIQAAQAQDMYRNQGNWAQSVGGKPAATYQQAVADQSQQPAALTK